MPKATTASKVTFISKYRAYQLVLEPSYPVISGPHKTWTPGITVQFEDSKFATDDVSLIEKLRACDSFGEDFFESEADLPKQNVVAVPTPSPDEPPVVTPRKRGARSTVDAVAKE